VFSVGSVPKNFKGFENISENVQLDKEKPGIGNIRGLNLAAVKSTAVQVSD
jgi:hypothetical protein